MKIIKKINREAIKLSNMKVSKVESIYLFLVFLGVISVARMFLGVSYLHFGIAFFVIFFYLYCLEHKSKSKKIK